MSRRARTPPLRRPRALPEKALPWLFLLGLAGLALGVWLVARGGRSPGPGEGAGVPRRRPEQRLLIVGWDGATFRMVDPLLRAGRLPNVARLLDRGSSASLASTVVPISSAAWVGAVTGKSPAHSGVYSFFEPVAGSYGVRLVSSLSVRAAPLWRILGRKGMRSVVFGVPITYPPEEIRGVMVAGMLSPRDSTYTWPPELAERLRARGFLPDLGIWREERRLSGELLERQLSLKRDVLLELLEGEDWDLAMVVFKSLDVLCHQAYDGRLDGPVAALYERLDAILGELVAAVGPGANVLLVSDHGFHAYPRTFHPHEWLVEQGFSVRREGFSPPELIGGPLAQRRAAEHSRRIEELDLARTRAFAGTGEGNFGGIRLNLRDREPQGTVAREDAGRVLAEIEESLRAAVVPATGAPLVVSTWRAEELYPGPFADELLPDLFFETDPSVAVSPMSWTSPFEELRGVFPDHDRAGILVAAGPAIAGVRERGEASILDLAPTSLALLGLPVYREMQGEVIAGLFAAPPKVSVLSEAEDPELSGADRRGSGAFSEEEAEEVKRRLAETGYVE